MHVRATAAGAALVAFLAACGSSGEEPRGIETRPDTAPSASTRSDAGAPSTAPEPTAGEGDRSAEPTADQDPSQNPGHESQPDVRVFDEAGVTVVMPDEVSDDSVAAALDVYAEYVVEWRRSLREVELSDKIRGLAAQPRIDRLEGSLEYQRQHGIRYGGEVTVEPHVEGASETVVTIGFCIDAAELVLIDDDGERPADGVDELPRTTGSAELNRTDAGWQVTDEVFSEDEEC